MLQSIHNKRYLTKKYHVQVREQRGTSEGNRVSFEDVTLVREEGEVHYGHLEIGSGYCEEGEDENST